MLKLLVCSFTLIAFPIVLAHSVAYAETIASPSNLTKDLCQNVSSDHAAKQTLGRAETTLRQMRPRLAQAILATSTGNCRATDLIGKGANPGERIPFLVAPLSCGAIINFSTSQQMHDAARFLRQQNLRGAICVDRVGAAQVEFRDATKALSRL